MKYLSEIPLKFTVISLVSAVLFGCATTGKFESRMEAKKGLTKEQLIDEMGIPDRAYKTDNFEIIEYTQSGVLELPSNSTSYIRGNQVHTTSFSSTIDTYCKLEFKLINNIVTAYRYNGNSCVSQ